MERWTIRGYANQVRLFLSLLVFFLAMQGALNFTLLFTAREGLVAAVRSRMAAAAGRIANEIPEEPPAAGVLAALARRHGVREVVLLDPAGLLLATSGGPAAGELDPDFADLSPEDVLGVRGGRDALLIDVPWRGEGRLALMRPLLASDGRVHGILGGGRAGRPDRSGASHACSPCCGRWGCSRAGADVRLHPLAAAYYLPADAHRWPPPGPASEGGPRAGRTGRDVQAGRQAPPAQRDAAALGASPLAGRHPAPVRIVASCLGRVSAQPAAARSRIDTAWAMGRP